MASLTETAKKVLMKEDMIPSVSSSQSDPDAGARMMTPNSATLRPGSRGIEPRFANPNAPEEGEFEQYEDLGGPVTSATDPNPYAKVKTKKDTSRSGQSAVPAEEPKTQGQGVMAEAELDEDVEISEELQAFIEEMIEEGYSDEEIAEAIDENFELVSEESHEEDDEEEKEEDKKEMKKEMKKANYKSMMKEHVDALLAGENLSENFRSKAETIFESAVSTRVQEEVEVLEEAYAKSLEEEVSQIYEQLIGQVDSYLNYVVEQWVKENEVAIESGLRSELTEEFISGLRNLFAEHYIDVPEEQTNILEEMGNKLEKIETRLNEEIDRNVSLTNMLNESKQTEILFSAFDGLTTTQAAKLRSLAENITFTTPEEYETKVQTLKESYFSKSVSQRTHLDPVEDADGRTMIAEDHVGPMANYVKAIGKTIK